VLASTLAAGCAVQHTVVRDGRTFPIEGILKADAMWRAGLDRDGVEKLFGVPYATGVDGDGHAFWEYRMRSATTTSGGGGILLVGVVG
jgi:hypothetical protein